MFNHDDDLYEDDFRDKRYNERRGGGAGERIALWFLKFIGVIFVLPAIIIGWIQFWALFMRGRQRLSVITIITTLELALLIPVMLLIKPLNVIKEVIMERNFIGVLPPYLLLCTAFGIIGAYILVCVKVHQFKIDPSILFMDGWTYKFSYKDTPWEKMKVKLLKKAMINGDYYGESESPLGILKEPIQLQVDEIDNAKESLTSNKAEVISRTYEDAMKHSVVTGETGSGKALHISTVIPTPFGFSTVGELSVGDIILDENKQRTTILAKFQPMTEDHYELSFNSGSEIVKACGDHLWAVVIDGEEVIKNTRDLIRFAKETYIEGFLGEKHTIDYIYPIIDKKEDYYCFTVDSPSSLFMCTESNIPTHNTVTMLSLLYNDIQNGYPVCVVDFKKSPDVLYFLSNWAKEYGREFYYFSGGDSSDAGNPFYGEKATYDPFASGDQNARADVVLNLRQWDQASAVYRDRTESILITLFFAVLNVDRNDVPSMPWSEGALNQIIAAMNLTVMYDLICGLEMKRDRVAGTRKAMNGTDLKRIETLKELYATLMSRTPEGKGLREQLEGIKLICNKLTMSSYGNWLSKGASSKHIDLLSIATSSKGPVVLFGLSPLEEEDFAKSMGGIIMSDLKRTAHTKNEMHNKVPFGVYVDEFQTINPADVTDLLEKSRSAKFFCTIASQSLEQIVVAAEDNGEATLKAVLDTCGNYIFHSGAKQDSAERMAKVLGQTKRVSRTSTIETNSKIFRLNLFNQRQGRSNKAEAEDWIISPSKFQNLSSPNAANGYKSEAYVITKVRSKRGTDTTFGAQRVQIIAQREITDGIPDEFLQFIGRSSAEKYKRQTGQDISDIAGINLGIESKVYIDESDEMDEIMNFKRRKEAEVIVDEEDVYEESSVEEEDDCGIEEIDSSSESSTEDVFGDASKPIAENKPSSPVTTSLTPKPTERKPVSVEPKRPLTSFERMQLAKNTKPSPSKNKSNEKKVDAPKVTPEPKEDKIDTPGTGFQLPDL